MAKDFPFSQLVLGVVSALMAMESAVSELMIAAWATVAVVLLVELFWKSKGASKLKFWTKLATAIVLSVGIYTATFREFIRPNIEIETGVDKPFILSDVIGDTWVRVRLYNRGWREVVCRFFLKGLEKKGAGRPILASGDSLQLSPSANEVGEGVFDRTIPSGDGRIFNLAHIKKGDNQLSIPSDQFSRQVSPSLGPGTYKFTVQATHGTCRSNQNEIWIKYDGGQQISFIDDR